MNVNKEKYRVQRKGESGSELVYMMGRPSRPRKCAIGAPFENYRTSTPSTTTPEHSVHGDETNVNAWKLMIELVSTNTILYVLYCIQQCQTYTNITG